VSTQEAPPAGGRWADALAAATVAFNNGNYREARTLAREAREGSADERAFAEQLLYRTGIDPAAIVVGITAIVIVLAIAWQTLG